jgi:hypothetical protein
MMIGNFDVRFPLGATEKLFWWMNQKRPAQFSVAAKVEGRTTTDAWRNALRCLQQRHPLLQVSIHSQAQEPYFQRESKAEIPLRVVEAHAPDSWKCEMERDLAYPFDDEIGPLMRATLVKNDNSSVILLTAHHSISDGLSAIYLIRDLLAAATGHVLDQLPVIPSNEQLAAQNEMPAKLDIAAQHLARTLLYVDSNLKPNILTHSLDDAFTAGLRERASREGVSLHAVLCAAAALARLGKGNSRRTIRVAFPASTRKVLGIGEDNGCYLTSGRVDLDIGHDSCLWSVARSVMPEIARVHDPLLVKSNLSRLRDAIETISDISAAAAFATSAFSADVVVTNLGEVSYSLNYGDLHLSTIWGPALVLGFAGLPILGAVAIHGRLNLLLTVFEPNASLLGDVVEILRVNCAGN